MSSGRRLTKGVAVALALFAGLVWADTQGYLEPATISGTNWTDPSNAGTIDATYAVYASTLQNDLKTSNHTFTIPAGSTINGIEVQVVCQSAAILEASRTVEVSLSKSNTAADTGYLYSDICGQDVDVTLTFGSPTDLWGLTWTVAEINASTLATWTRRFTSIGIFSVSVDAVQIRVTYTTSAKKRYHTVG